MAKTKDYFQKSIRIVGFTVLIYAVLVATHRGEFWPFSIYPMFSQAGKPWKRAVVRDVTNTEKENIWQVSNKSGLIGEPVPLKKLNINTNDIANFLSKTDTWTESKIGAVRKLFSEEIITRDLLVYQARGSLARGDTVEVKFYPFIFVTRDTTVLNKELTTDK